MPEALPLRIGRYEIVGRLATGGMAEVVLGRLRGPFGFERPVVLKRMLPHLAREPATVAMFLDEARIIANLRHPNLVHVQELGHEGDELFLVMEFLEGETISGLCRRLASRDELLDVHLAAHVLAEACAGLHAAHEATSPDGRPLGIVHRDVSPQNLFVTYAGAVHVIDFGIATTTDRVSRTDAGTVRGKFEYLAPEQIHGQRLDRRTDVFALGITLMELVTGRRAYLRGSHAESMMAILHEPAPRLASVRPGTPGELEAICARALAKSPSERFQSAADMRRDLLAFARKGSADDLGEALGREMRRLFADRVAEKAEMLGRVGRGAELAHLPPAEVDVEVELGTLSDAPAAGAATTVLSRSVPVVRPTGTVRAGRPRRWALAAGALGLLATAAWWAVAPSVRGGEARSQAAEPPPGAATASTGVSPTPSAEATRGVGAASASNDPGAIPAPSARPDPRPAPPSRRRPASPPKATSAAPAPTIW